MLGKLRRFVGVNSRRLRWALFIGILTYLLVLNLAQSPGIPTDPERDKGFMARLQKYSLRSIEDGPDRVAAVQVGKQGQCSNATHIGSSDISVVERSTAEKKASGMTTEVDMDSVLEPVQKEELKRTFQLMKEDSDQNGVSIFVRLFQEYPNYKLIFPKLKFMTDGEMSNSTELKIHGDLVWKELGGIIGSLDDPDKLSLTLHKMAAKHKKFGVKRHHIQSILPEIMGVLKLCMGATTPEIDEAWFRLINYIGELVDRIKLEKKN